MSLDALQFYVNSCIHIVEEILYYLLMLSIREEFARGIPNLFQTISFIPETVIVGK